MSGFEGRDAIAGYLASKGLPMTGENVRRALEQNASNPGLIKGLVNQAPPPPDEQGGASPTSNQRGSAAASLASRMHQAPQQQQQPAASTPQQPQAMSDSAASQPASSGGGAGMLGSLAQMILGGGAGAGLAHLFMGGRGSPVPQYNIPYPTADGAPQLGASQPQIGSDPMQLPAPTPQLGAAPTQAQLPAPSKQLAAPQAPAMPQGAAPASDVASRAPVSIVPREVGADAADLGGHMDWAKILGDIGHAIGRR